MKKQILSILLALIMVTCLVPTAVQAEEGGSEYTIESREGASTTETVTQPGVGEYTEEVESVSQNGETPTAEIFSSTNVTGIASQTVSVGSKDELVAALEDTTVDIVQLDANISLGGGVTLTVARKVTLDLNGYVLKGSGRSVFEIKDGGHMIVTDSRPTEKHKFWVNNSYSYGVWNWNDQGGDEDKTVLGGAITGGYDVDGGGGVKVRDGGRLTMNGGNIVGCGSSSAEGGGVKVNDGGVFEMNGNAAIVGCAAQSRDGGGVYVAEKGTFVMNSGTIRDCVSRGVGSGGGVCNKGKFTMNDGTIRNCAAPAGGAVYHYNYSGDPLTLNGTIISDNSDQWQPVYVQSDGTVIIGAAADIQANMFLMNCTVLTNGGVVRGDVYVYNHATFSVDEGVIQSTIFYGKFSSNYNVNGVAVTYQVNGADYATQFLNSSNAATKPDDPTAKTGYNFDGWYKADGTKWDFDTVVTENITLTGWQYLPVDNASALGNAMADPDTDVIRLTGDIEIDTNLNVDRAVTLDLNGHVLRYYNANVLAGQINVNGNGNLTLVDSNPDVEHRFTDLYGGGLWILDETNGDKIAKGGIITACIVSVYGGTFTMDGGSIVGSQGRAGAVAVDNGGTFTMNAGLIRNCYSPSSGAVYVGDSTVTLNGGSIEECYLSSDLVGMYLTRGAVIANGGKVDGMVYIEENSKIISSAGASGVTTFRGELRMTESSTVEHGIYYGGITVWQGSTISGLTVTYKDGDTDYAKQILTSGKTATRPDDPTKPGYLFDGWRTADGKTWDYTTPVTEDITLTAHWIINTRDVTNEQELTDALTGTSVGQIRLTDDIDISKELLVTRAVILDLNGHVLRQTKSGWLSFSVESGGDLTIIDSNPTAEHRFTPDNKDLWVLDEQNGTKTVLGGVITGSADGQTGGGIGVSGGTFTLKGGGLVGCSVTKILQHGVDNHFGGVYVADNGTFNMTGGVIQGCYSAASDGGGVFVADGQFTMTGGSITDCVADLGGGVYVLAGTFKLDGGDIRGCTAGGGGGVFVYMKGSTRGIFEMSGGSIADCTADKGSALYLYNGIMYADGGTVDGTVWVDDRAYSNTDSKITTNGINGVTSFKKGVTTQGANSRIEYGIYYGGITGDGTVSSVTMTYLNDGAEYAKQMLPSAGLATQPDDPAAKTGYTFGGWNKTDGTAWDYASDTVTGDITLHAKWTLCDHKSSTKQPNCTESAICTKCAGTIPALGHDYSTPDYKWNGTECTAHRVCANDASHEESETVTAAVNVTRNGSCELDELSTYTATFKNKAFAKQTKQDVVTANKLGHDFTVPQHDETQHWNKCSRCDATDTKADHTGGKATCTEQAVCTVCSTKYGNALGHDFGTPDYTWNGTECTAHRVCANDASHEENETVTAAVNVTRNRGCVQDELSTYTATFKNPAFDAQTKQNVATANKLGHDFTVPQHDEIQHWNKCSRCDATDEKRNHTGGRATCIEQAICEICHSPYGEFDGTNHIGGTKIRNRKSQNCTENGYTGDTYCKGCGKKLSSGTVINADGHKGGTASCADKAECEVCHEKYGELDKNNHIGLEKVNAIPATAASTGTIEYWRCTACGKLFADADGKREINSEDTVAKKLAPSILDGANGKWKKGDENGLIFQSDAAFSDFVEVLVNGKTVAPENYTKREDGIIVELKASYLETLAEGEYTLTICSASGDATTEFTVEAEVVTSSTDSTNIEVWVIIGVVALGAGIAVVALVARKRKTV